MVLVYKEKTKSDFEGTVIDIETIGNFADFNDSRRYKDIEPVIFGFIRSKGLSIYCAKNEKSINKLKGKISLILDILNRPFYAFNSIFERSVFFHSLNKKVIFERELNKDQYESKSSTVFELGISQYDDPFNDNGMLCMDAWLRGELKEAIAHNRSCLLKERDILLKRGFREPDELEFVDI